MENPEETLQVLEEWATRRARPGGGGVGGPLPRQLDEYLAHVARTGDPVFNWSSVKPLFKEKLLNAVNEFHETAPGLDVPLAPNVDPFNYEAMRSLLLERLDSFNAAPFTVQRLCELLTAPRKQYNRIDKFMRAVEKNVLVVSTREPGSVRRDENESLERALNGSDANSDCGVDVDMEDPTWRDLRQPAEDPLASVSNPEPERPPECSTPLPGVPAAVQESLAPVEEKMEEATEPVGEAMAKEESPKIEEKAEIVIELKSQAEGTESMEVEVTKDPEQNSEISTPKVFVVSSVPEIPVVEPKTNEPAATENTDNVTVSVISSSEDDSNSNPEPVPTLPETEPEVQKHESVTSGEDSSSSSENTDGEERTAGDSSTSQQSEPSTMSEGDSSNEPTESNTVTEQKEQKEKVKEVLPSIEPENYTIADIPAQPTEEENAEKKLSPDLVPSTPDIEEKPVIPVVETSEDPSVPSAPVEEPMQTDSTENTPEPL